MNIPIYRILVFQHPNKELINSADKATGWPDIGASKDVGFYFENDIAVKALNENWANLHEYLYNAAFIYKQYPGLYESANQSENRTYYVWNDEKQGFFEQPEPPIFHHVNL